MEWGLKLQLATDESRKEILSGIYHSTYCQKGQYQDNTLNKMLTEHL